MKQAEAVASALRKLQAVRDARPQAEKDREKAEMAEIEREGTTPAPDGQVYVCGACGKTSTTRYGLDAKNGWDESCMLNAVLCFAEKVDGKWRAAPNGCLERKGGSDG